MARNIKDFKSIHSEKVVELKEQLKEKDRILSQYRKAHGKLQVFFDEVFDAITPVTPIPGLYEPMKVVDHPVTVVLDISDVHMGEVQESYEIEGINAYNPTIAHDRCVEVVRKFIDWVEGKRHTYTINEGVIIMNGDLISGDIHQELLVTNAFPSPVQVVEAAKTHATQLAMLAPHFEKITVHFITEDNHSRLTQKPQAKEAGQNSLNYLVGHLLSAYIQKHGNIEFNIYPMLEKVVSVMNRKYLICHGHSVRGWMGVPWYGIERKVGKESQARMRLMMKELAQNDVEKAKTLGFNKYVMGHFHTPFEAELYLCNGSVSGTNAYDHKEGRFAEPSQSAWCVHPKWPEFDRINFSFSHII